MTRAIVDHSISRRNWRRSQWYSNCTTEEAVQKMCAETGRFPTKEEDGRLDAS